MSGANPGANLEKARKNLQVKLFLVGFLLTKLSERSFYCCLTSKASVSYLLLDVDCEPLVEFHLTNRYHFGIPALGSAKASIVIDSVAVASATIQSQSLSMNETASELNEKSIMREIYLTT